MRSICPDWAIRVASLPREQKRHIRKNHLNFLKTLWMAGCPGKNALFCVFFYSKHQEIPGTPAGRPLFVPPGVPGTPGRCPEDFLNFTCLFSRVRPPGIEWKTSRNPKLEKHWPKNRQWPSDRNGGKMAQNGEEIGFGVIFLFFRHLWAIFS